MEKLSKGDMWTLALVVVLFFTTLLVARHQRKEEQARRLTSVSRLEADYQALDSRMRKTRVTLARLESESKTFLTRAEQLAEASSPPASGSD